MLTIFSPQGHAKLSVAPSESDAHSHEIQGDNQLTLSFVSTEAVRIDVGDYVEWEGTRFLAMERSLPTEVSSVEWRYALIFYGIESLVKRFLVLSPSGEPTFTLTSPAVEHVRLVVASINAAMGGTSWKVGRVDASDNIVIDYNGTYCDEALRTIAERAKTEWWVEGQTLNLTRCEQGTPQPLAYGRGLTSLEVGRADNAKLYTRLYPVGSSRNIVAATYGAPRLRLPKGAKYVETADVATYGIIDHFEREAFAHIYPRRIGTVASVRTEQRKVEGKEMVVYFLTDTALDFDPNDHELAGETKRITFQEGSELAGREFECNYNSLRKEFELITQWLDDGRTQLPSPQLAPKVGDRYILHNIRMPESYVRAAEQELLDAVKAYNAQHARDISTYRARTDFEYLLRHPFPLRIGQRVRLESTEFFPTTGFRESRITKVSQRLATPTLADIEVGDALSQGAMQRLSDGVKSVEQEVRRVRSELPDLITTADTTLPTDSNIYSARRANEEFVSSRHDDTARGHLTLQKGASFGHFNQGQLVGTGARIDASGNAEVESLRVRSTMEVTKLVVNEQLVQQGDTLFSEGAEVESVEVIDAARRLYRIRLKPRFAGDALPFVEGDVLRGVMNALAGRAAGLSGEVEGAAFFTSWLRVEALRHNDHSIEAVLYPDDETPAARNFAPVPLMELARWGNADSVNHPDRQQLFYISSRDGRIAKLSGVTRPIVDISNLTATFGTLPEEVQRYLGGAVEQGRDYVYLKGAVIEDLVHIDRQLGRPRSEIVWRGVWTAGEAYHDGTTSIDGRWEQSKVSYHGCQYLCTKAHTATDENAPRYGNTSWLMVEGDPEFRASIVEPEQLYDLADFHATATIRATLHHQDVTRHCLVSWTRHTETADGSPRTLSDELWARRFVEHGRDAMRLELTKADLDYPAGEPLRTIRFVAVVRLVEADNVYTNTLSIAF